MLRASPGRTTIVILASVAVALASGAAPASAAVGSPPSLRLLAGSSKVAVVTEGERLAIDPGVFVAAVGGDFELRVSRPTYRSPLTFTQVDSRSGAVLRKLPSRLVRGFSAPRRFARVTLRDRRGRRVAARSVSFCPGGERQRLDGEGPTVPRYPESCAGVPDCTDDRAPGLVRAAGCGGFPFTKGMVWGIDRGWAVNVFSTDDPPVLRAPRRRVPSGRYTVRVQIAARYARLFAIPPRAARVTLAATVKRVRRRSRRGPDGSRPADFVTARTRRLRAVSAVTAPDPSVVPDLVALPSYGIVIANGRRRSVIRFNSTSWNAGPAPLVIEGFRRPRSSVMAAYQFFHDATGQSVGRAPAGTMRYHGSGGHDHWHFLQFAQYYLLDASKRTRLRGTKQSFCLVPTDAVDLTLPGAAWQVEPTTLSSACGTPSSIWIRETLPVGWGDTYGAGLDGQSLDVTGLANGRYHLRTRVNPLGVLRERTTANNVATRTIRLTGRRGKRRVAVSPWRGIRE